MTKTEMNRYKGVLEAAVVELDRSVRRREAVWVEGSADALDRTLRATECDLAVLNLEAASAKLWDAQAALERIEDGSYGICLECDEPISLMRLAAMPSAACCIRCQQSRDTQRVAKTTRLPLMPMAA
jgi:DnaK suppressor protein